jgi:hypothetical protein
VLSRRPVASAAGLAPPGAGRRPPVLLCGPVRPRGGDPRRATGTDVADLLGISQPTFSEHLRLAEQRAFSMLLDGEGLEGPD